MGTKQLLLIALGVIIVGTAVAVSLNLFNTQFSGQIRDMAIQQMHEIGTLAKTYRATPTEGGGGGGTYTGFKLPNAFIDDALTWKFDFKFGSDNVFFYMISKQIFYNDRPLYLLGLHQKGEFVYIRLFDPEKNSWETIVDNRSK